MGSRKALFFAVFCTATVQLRNRKMFAETSHDNLTIAYFTHSAVLDDTA